MASKAGCRSVLGPGDEARAPPRGARLLGVPRSDFELIFEELNRGSVRYLVAGGVAVVLHGHPRFTADLDLIVGLEPENALAAVGALARLGYRPRAPVPAEAFADPVQRAEWARERGMAVFSLWSPEHPVTEVDLFVDPPIPFAEAYGRATWADLGGLRVAVASIEDLIDLKQRAGRPKDLEDIRLLRTFQESGDG